MDKLIIFNFILILIIVGIVILLKRYVKSSKLQDIVLFIVCNLDNRTLKRCAITALSATLTEFDRH